MKTAVIIARFQTPYLHEGHQNLISQVREAHSKLIILLGDKPPGRQQEKSLRLLYPRKDDQGGLS